MGKSGEFVQVTCANCGHNGSIDGRTKIDPEKLKKLKCSNCGTRGQVRCEYSTPNAAQDSLDNLLLEIVRIRDERDKLEVRYEELRTVLATMLAEPVEISGYSLKVTTRNIWKYTDKLEQDAKNIVIRRAEERKTGLANITDKVKCLYMSKIGNTARHCCPR